MDLFSHAAPGRHLVAGADLDPRMTVPRTSRNVETAPLSDGGLMIVDLATGDCWQLNRLGAEVWELFESGSSFDGVVRTLSQRYRLGTPLLEADLSAIVRDLEDRGLLLSTKSG